MFWEVFYTNMFWEVFYMMDVGAALIRRVFIDAY